MKSGALVGHVEVTVAKFVQELQPLRDDFLVQGGMDDGVSPAKMKEVSVKNVCAGVQTIGDSGRHSQYTLSLFF
jgi:hypothetical protein